MLDAIAARRRGAGRDRAPRRDASAATSARPRGSRSTGGADALDAVQLEVLRPVQPMLAGEPRAVADALAATGLASVEWKLDGARIQVHRARRRRAHLHPQPQRRHRRGCPRSSTVVPALPAPTLVLDGEAIGVAEDGRPHAFQDTMSRFGTSTTEPPARTCAARVLLRRAARRRRRPPRRAARRAARRCSTRRRAARCVVPSHRSPTTPSEAAAFLDDALAAGPRGRDGEGARRRPYDAGRRGKAWRKVKPVHTLDLVVLAAEWGHGRRRGWLSNLHLGARDPDGDGS